MQAPQRSKLRATGCLANLLARGRPRQAAKPTSRAGAWKRAHKDRARQQALQHIIIGAGVGRCGSTCLAANLQNQGWDVSHEAGNSRSLDRRANFTDRFKLHCAPKSAKRTIADNMVEHLRTNPRAQAVVGDISWTNTPLAEAMLESDPRVRIVFQTRPPEQWVTSHLRHHARPGRWEGLVLGAYGIKKAQEPSRRMRLILWARSVAREAKRLKAKWPRRVAIVPLCKLNSWGRNFLRHLGAPKPWDGERGKNAEGESRHELRLARKRPASAR